MATNIPPVPHVLILPILETAVPHGAFGAAPADEMGSGLAQPTIDGHVHAMTVHGQAEHAM
jgi:hypothetical protein